MRGFIIFITLVLFFSLCTGLIICWIANFTNKGKVGLSMRKMEYVVCEPYVKKKRDPLDDDVVVVYTYKSSGRKSRVICYSDCKRTVRLGNRARLVIKYGKPRSKFWRFMQDIGKGNGIYEAELTLPKTMDFNDRTILQNLFLG